MEVLQTYAERLSASMCPNQLVRRFELVKIWATISKVIWRQQLTTQICSRTATAIESPECVELNPGSHL
jgi:hypothetical protein